jgi:uncharacterized protein (AIM24 family)
MRDPAPRAPFDQGLFLTHFNKGKSLYDESRFPEAEQELEEAYLLRPRDHSVLNLLGLVYFKQDKLEKAEEVYRKLAAESPEVPILYYNLGLIHFKLGRLEEAELSFLKALQLSKGNPKINFYLGSVYERMQRFQDAIYQYRRAGAHMMVRRMEDKLAAGTPRRPPSTGVREDTAEFKTGEVREALKRRAEEAIAPERPLQPVSRSLMAEWSAQVPEPGTAPPPAGPSSDPSTDPSTDPTTDPATDPAYLDRTASYRPPLPPPRPREILSFPAAPAPPVRGGHDDRREAFRFLENNLMEVEFSGKLFIKQGTIYSYGGNLTFWVKDRRQGGFPALVIITGTGKVILTDREREITFMRVVEGEPMFVEPSHLLACEETLTPRYVTLGGTASGLEFLALEGRGMLALSVASKPLALEVTPELPVSVHSASIITWTGDLTPRIVDDRQVYEILLPAGRRAGSLVRLEGSGRLLVEQAPL